MDTFLPVLCLLAGILLPLAAFFLLVRRGVRQLRVASAYREVSWRLGLAVDTRGVSLRGHVGDRRVWIGEVMVAYGAERRTAVRGVVGLERPLGLGLLLRRKGRSDRLMRRRAPELALGQQDLDRVLHVQGDEPERVKALFTPPVLEALRALLGQWPDVVLTDEDVRVDLRQAEEDPTRLQALLDAMLALAAALEAARREVDPPTELQPLVEPWGEIARSLGLRLEPWLPAITGVLDGHRVLITARRTVEGYAASLQVWFNPHSDMGLLLRPQVEPDGYWSVGQDIQVGDPEFDDAFVIKGYDPAAVRALLNTPVRNGLLDLRRLSPLVVDDRAMLVYEAPLDPEALLPALRSAAATARAMGW